MSLQAVLRSSSTLISALFVRSVIVLPMLNADTAILFTQNGKVLGHCAFGLLTTHAIAQVALHRAGELLSLGLSPFETDVAEGRSMARTITITSPTEKTAPLMEDLKKLDCVLDIKFFRGASVQPSGDVISLCVPNRQLNHVMRLLDRHELGKKEGISASTSDAESYIPTGSRHGLERDNNEATWEEMVTTISDDSNTSLNTILAMIVSGALASVGILTDAVHLVIAGMLSAPGFMPIVRIALGALGRRPTWRYGVADLLKGYAALILGAALAAMVVQLLGYSVPGTGPAYYSVEKSLMMYWSSITPLSILSSIAAAAVGALLIATNRSVLTSGVMVGLALIPGSAIVGIGLTTANWTLVQDALARVATDAVLVLLLSLTILGADKHYQHRRDIRL